ncbi:MAG: DUF1572 family protein [Saprospiraceae bacterium]|nr:DUF1572 family protein [Saprospiraceae bacterium]
MNKAKLRESLKKLFVRDLEKLQKEIESYRDEASMWVVDGEIKNSGGNLCLHLIGNLKTYIGTGLGNKPYQRNRTFEFSGKGVKREELLSQIEETKEVVIEGLDALEKYQIGGSYPMVIWNQETELIYTIVHLHSHLNYHLGQINYHRRLFDKG